MSKVTKLFLPPPFVKLISTKMSKGTLVPETPYLMSATHRGDMYHVRASMAIKPRGIILYESDPSEKTRALEEYLLMSAAVSETPCLIVTWSREDLLTGQQKNLDFTNCTLNGEMLAPVELKETAISFISEGGSTEIIAKNVNSADQMNTVIEHMALPKREKERAKLDEEYAKIVEKNKLFPKVKEGVKTVLILFRDTSSLGGAYPELDSGDGMINFIAIVEKMAMHPILAGNEKSYAKADSIGPYWLLLAPVAKDFKLPLRDVEAYFMKWAFSKGFFNMVLGFRSGVLDSFTFLGVPTVSVGLRFLAGEERHVLLAKEVFKRVNIAYDQARHNATAWVQFRSNDPKEARVVLQSPFWLGVAAKDVRPRPTVDHNKSLKTPPSLFQAFDATVVDMGFRVACEKDLNMGKTVGKYGAETREINVSTARSTYYLDQTKTEEDIQAYFSNLQALDSKTLAEHCDPERIASLQERTAETERYLKESDDNWKILNTQINPTFSEYM